MKQLLLPILLLFTSTFSYADSQTTDGLFTYIPPIEKSFKKFGSARNSALDSDSFKVMVWNIYKGDMDDFEADIKRLAPTYDLLMIQEAVTTKMDIFNSMKGFDYSFGVSFGYTRHEGKFTGTMIGSKVVPTKAWMARTKELEPVVRTPKALTMSTFSLEGSSKKLLLVNIHGLNVTGHAAYESHLALSIAQMKGHTGPIIFAGDFNTRTDKRLKVTRERLGALGFQEMTFRNDERMRGKLGGKILDHVFTKGLEIIDSEVLGHLESSDHKAMVFEARAL